MLFYLYFFHKVFSFFCVFRAITAVWGHCTNPKLNRVKNRLSVLFAKKLRVFPCSILNTSFPCLILNMDCFRFSVFLSQLLLCGHILPTPNLLKTSCHLRKNTVFPCSILNRGFPCSILNTDQHGKNTGFFSVKYRYPYIDLHCLEKNFGSVFFAFLQLFHLNFF